MAFPAIAIGAGLAGLLQTVARFLIPYIIVKVLIGLGITVVTITGSLWLVSYVEDSVTAQFNNLVGDVGQILIMCGVLDGLTIVFNSWVVAFNIKMLFRGSRRFAFGGGAA